MLRHSVAGLVLALLAAWPALTQDVEPVEVEPVLEGEAVPSAWLARCASEGRPAPLACTLEQRLFVQETGRPFLTLAIQVAAPGAVPMLAIQTPLGVHLPTGLALRVDDGEAIALPLESCDANGCHTRQAVAEPLLDALLRGRMLHLGMRGAPDQTIDVEIPLDGFGPGFAAVR